MAKKFQQFEKFIQRIHSLIEGENAEVKWNQKIIDPDSPSRTRQVDVTIRKNNKLTLVECRDRVKKQDVQWVEELIGRKISLNADVIIAVSFSGFTEGAITKAKKHKIVLHDLKKLTDEEIKSWGSFTPAYITFYQYKDIEIIINVGRGDVEAAHVIAQQYYKDTLIKTFNATKTWLDDKDYKDPEFSTINMSIKPDGEIVVGLKVLEILLTAKVRLLRYDLEMPDILAYATPEEDASDRDVKIEKHGDYGFELIHHNAKIQAWMDFAGIEYPPNAQFQYLYFYVDGPRTLFAPQVGNQVNMGIHIEGIGLSVGVYDSK